MFFSKSTLFSIATASLFAFKDVSAKIVELNITGVPATVEDGGRRLLDSVSSVDFHLDERTDGPCVVERTLLSVAYDAFDTTKLQLDLAFKTNAPGSLIVAEVDNLGTPFPVSTGTFVFQSEPLFFLGQLGSAFPVSPVAGPLPVPFTVYNSLSPGLGELHGQTVVTPSKWTLTTTTSADFSYAVESIVIILDCLGTTNDIIGQVGDPHFTTFADKHYDFQGECDLVTVQNNGYKNGKGMHVHTRTKNYGSWSSTTSAAVKIGDDVIEVHGEDMALINGVEYPVPEIEGSEFNFPMTIGDYALTVQILGPHSRRHIIHMGDGEKIMINNFKEFVDVEFEGVKAEDYDGAVGMLGAYSQGGAMMGRDGKTVFEDADAFGQEWQVNPTDPHLFHIIDGPQYPARCNMPEAPTAEQRHLRAMAKKVSEDDAKKACANASRKENCIADVFGSDNLDMANIYTMGSL